MPLNRPTELDAYDVEALVWYLSTAQGGRKAFIESGCWGRFHYEGADWEARQYFQDPPFVLPGEHRMVKFSFLSPEEHVGRLVVGTVFLLREGLRVIGYGRVTAILHLDHHAQERMTLLELQTRPG